MSDLWGETTLREASENFRALQTKWSRYSAMVSAGTFRGTYRRVRDLETPSALYQSVLYKLSKAVSFEVEQGYGLLGEAQKRERTRYVRVTSRMFQTHGQCSIFAADRDGEVLCFSELEGSYGTLEGREPDAEAALNALGYLAEMEMPADAF